jgi:hypothetical protein
MKSKQTAVDWLEDKINNYDFNQGMAQMRKYIQQAKQIEKEQIKDAFDIGYSNYLFDGGGEQYYNETYNVKDN